MPHLQGVEGTHATSRGQTAASPPADVSPTEVVRQVARQLEALPSGRGTSSVTLQLEPEHLGRLRVTVFLSEGTVHARIVAESPMVRQMLESHSSLLQQALQERGLQLGALQVFVQGEGRQFLTYHAHAPLTTGQGWFHVEETAPTPNEGSFWHPQTGGVNLLV